MRLDSYIFNQKLTDSRNRAKALILNSKVIVDGKIIKKPSFIVEDFHKVEILEDLAYVSRAGDKLKAFLDRHKDISIKDKYCLDIGSSTGGFIEVLLEFGAKRVVGVDVGSNQLHQKIKENSRVESHEEIDIRLFKSDKLFDVVTCDVSFVSLEYILPSIDRLSAKDIIILFKPQFEVGKNVKRSRRGVVKDEKAIIHALDLFENHILDFGYKMITKENSQIKGKEGNIEVFYHFQK
jgi:23S rRNA (cytidine1920-2'-O)/16S rRNA (cytidine1409-2'-O)-methyltransferase